MHRKEVQRMVSIDLTGKVAIVVGAGRGIGEAIALKFAEAGADVVVADRMKDNIDNVVEKVKAIGKECMGFEADVTKYEDLQNVVAETVAKYGKVDIMANNAGVNVIKLFVDSTPEEFDWIVDINLKGIYKGCRAVIDQMIKQGGGVICNTSSQAGVREFMHHSMYAASKYGVRGMSDVMALELGKYGIRVNCLCPGIVRTDMWEQNLVEYDGYDNSVTPEQRWAAVVDRIPMKRAQTPEDMANAVLFLCSDLAKNISGQSLMVNGASVCC